MPVVPSNGIEIAYEESGSGPPLLLVMGLAGQLTDWPDPFVDRLGKHFRVIRFDNRDSGLSTHVAAPMPSRWDIIRSSLFRSPKRLAYTLDEMADDAAGLLNALGIGHADILGMSMGGMIAQLVAIRHSDLVGSLTSVMSNTGDRWHGLPSPRVMRALSQRGQPSRGDAVDTALEFFALIGGPDWDEADQRERTTRSVARAYDPAGVFRQSAAIAGASDRSDALRSLTHPTLVVHGLDDTLVNHSGGVATARAVPNSRLLLFPRMGHDIPATRHDEIVAAVVANAQRATKH